MIHHQTADPALQMLPGPGEKQSAAQRLPTQLSCAQRSAPAGPLQRLRRVSVFTVALPPDAIRQDQGLMSMLTPSQNLEEQPAHSR